MLAVKNAASPARIPKYRKHKATGQARVTLNGKTRYLGRWNTAESKERYKAVIGSWLAGNRHLPERGEGLSVNELILAYVRFAQGYYVKDGKETDELNCIRSAVRPLKELYGYSPTAEFSPLALKAVRQRMIGMKSFMGNTWSRNFVNKSVGRIKRMFRWGVENELVSVTTYQALNAVAGLAAGRSEARETAKRHPVPAERIDSVKAVVSELVRDLIDLQLLTACRPGELLSLKGAMIDRSGPIWTAKLEHHKCERFGKERTLYFGPRAQLILRKYLAADPQAKLFYLRRDSYSPIIKAACKKAIPYPAEWRDEPIREKHAKVRQWWKQHHWTPHWLRHTAGTYVLNEFGAEAARTLLGHAKLDMTAHYTREATEQAKRVVAQVG